MLLWENRSSDTSGTAEAVYLGAPPPFLVIAELQEVVGCGSAVVDLLISRAWLLIRQR